MRLKISKSKNAQSLYVIKSIYKNGFHTSKIVEKLGTYDDLLKKVDGEDPIEWAKKHIEELNKKEKEEKREILVKYSTAKIIKRNQQVSFNGGYLFLQKIYHELGLHQICSRISDKYKFSFDLDSVLSRLIYGRIIYPASKLATHKLSSKLIEPPNFDIQHIYRSLEILAKESDFIQSSLYKNSLKVTKRNTSVLYYDCTNYFFETPQEDGLKQYGPSKEHRPSPIVQMGLFMDADGMPLAFSINKGNMNEQLTLKPLERKIISDFDMSKFVVCTDAGLASNDNIKFNNRGQRAVITTQSIKKLKKYLKEWSLDPTGWKLSNDKEIYDLSTLDETLENLKNEADKIKWKSKVFYKERWINENGLEQRFIVSFSLKYRDYQRTIRNSQIERAKKKIDSNPTTIGKPRQNDFKRFIKTTTCTQEGEIATKKLYNINKDIIEKEEAYDGFYGICTNHEDDISKIIEVNKQRWQIEECFRIMKSEFKVGSSDE
ncbi:MAG: IS1634 family transposase [Alkaliphilus sp.]